MKQSIFGLLVVAIALPAAVACSGASSTPPDAYKSDSKAATTSSANVPPHAAPAATPTANATGETAAAADPKAGTTPKDPTTKKPSPADQDGENGADGNSIMASGEHCCFNGKYLRCPNANACTGGFDVNACIERCGFADVRCITDCTNNPGLGAGPVGCDAKAAPPPGVDCANGTIELRD